jgi:glycine dehydrogenase subunit 2
VQENRQYTLKETDAPLGRIKAFQGQFGTFVRALAYMMTMGSDGLKQASTDAVLNANYIRKNLENDLTLSFDGICMHEVLADERFLKNTGVTTLDFAKAMIDKGFHPMTMYFPLVVQGAMLIEPTETESKQTLDAFIAAMKELVAEAKAGNVDLFKNAPQTAPRTRSDETAAARKPVLKW